MALSLRCRRAPCMRRGTHDLVPSREEGEHETDIAVSPNLWDEAEQKQHAMNH
jgi:hypothetical protein